MKRILSVIALLFPLSIAAQEPVVIEETFSDGSDLEWSETADKKNSALLKEGYFELLPAKKGGSASTETSLPIDLTYDYDIESTVFLPNLDNRVFGMTFGSYALFVSEGSAAIAKPGSGEEPVNTKIKLTGGKNRTVVLGLKQSAAKSVFTVNNMTVGEMLPDSELTEAKLGFFTTAPMHIQSVKIEQK